MKQHKRVMIVAENHLGLPIIDFARVHEGYTGPDTFYLGPVVTLLDRVMALAELRQAFDRYCDAV